MCTVRDNGAIPTNGTGKTTSRYFPPTLRGQTPIQIAPQRNESIRTAFYVGPQQGTRNYRNIKPPVSTLRPTFSVTVADAAVAAAAAASAAA